MASPPSARTSATVSSSGPASMSAAAGYRRTRMADVAVAAGVSPGLLYTYAESKEALFALVVQREAGVDIATLPLPVGTPSDHALVALVRRSLGALVDVHTLDAA